RRCVQARWLCHQRIAKLPPKMLHLYRGRVDAQAKKWLQQGIDQHDTAALRRIITEHFCSSVTDRALLVLGDLAFERGDFDEALHWWLLLAAPASAAADPLPGLRFPNPQVDIPGVRARQILAWLFQRQPWRAEEELTAFRRLHPRAEGSLAGKKGRYVDLLQELLAAAQKGLLTEGEPDWPTFAGSP